MRIGCTMNTVKVKCFDCNHEFDAPADAEGIVCPGCGSEDVVDLETEKAAE